MIVRCGNCRSELEVAGPGEFVCPACGTRNAVRGAPAPSPFDLPTVGGPGVPGAPGAPPPGGSFAPPAPPPPEPSNVRWITCPGCTYRFAIGEVDEVSCPTCSTTLSVTDDGVTQAPAE